MQAAGWLSPLFLRPTAEHVMPNFSAIKGEYGRLLSTVRITRENEAATAARKVIRNSGRYKEAGLATGVPWPLIGVLDLRESDCDPLAALGQGDPWNQVSTHVPRGKGPFKSWVAAAVFYLHYDGVEDPSTPPWDMVDVCFEGEKWNGWGYRNKGIFTPYLWAGTNQYTRGKYVADGVYDPGEVDKQLGIIPVLLQMFETDPTITISHDFNPGPPPIKPEPAPYTETGTRWIQSRLNILMVALTDDPESLEMLLRVDGIYGRRTAAAVRSFQTYVGLEPDGQAGDLTTAAMDAELAKIR